MTRLIVDPLDPDLSAIERAAAIVRDGGAVAYPTETLYGLAVDPRSDAAVRTLYELKARETGSPVALIAADSLQAEAAGTLGAPEKRLAAAFWPGPLTIVVPSSALVSRLLSAGTRTVGIRVPGHPVARALARALGFCITATSANLSGRPAASTPSEIAAALLDRVELLIDAGPTPGGPPSTVVELVDGVPTLHRAGAIAWNRVLESLE